MQYASEGEPQFSGQELEKPLDFTRRRKKAIVAAQAMDILPDLKYRYQAVVVFHVSHSTYPSGLAGATVDKGKGTGKGKGRGNRKEPTRQRPW